MRAGAHVEQPEGVAGVPLVQGGEHEVPGERAQADLLAVSGHAFADHDDIRVLAQHACRAAKSRPIFGVALTWVRPGNLVSTGSSTVMILVCCASGSRYRREVEVLPDRWAGDRIIPESRPSSSRKRVSRSSAA